MGLHNSYDLSVKDEEAQAKAGADPKKTCRGRAQFSQMIPSLLGFICFSRMNSCVNQRQGLCRPHRREIQSLELSCFLIINIKDGPKVTQRCNIYIHPESDCDFFVVSKAVRGNESC